MNASAEGATGGSTVHRAGWRRWLGVLAVVALVAGVAAAVAGRDDGAVTIDVVGAPADDLATLVGDADLVVVGRVVATSPGRVVSGPTDPTRAVRTRLAQLVVDEVTVGPPVTRVVLEEVAALADGTPATIEGLAPSRVGDAGLYLLVRGEGGRAGLACPQGRYLLDRKDPDRLVAPLPGDLLAARLAALGPRTLRRAVLDVAADGTSTSAEASEVDAPGHAVRKRRTGG